MHQKPSETCTINNELIHIHWLRYCGTTDCGEHLLVEETSLLISVSANNDGIIVT